MTAKAPTPMPENIQRPKPPSAPPKLHNVVNVDIKIYERSKYPVYAFDMWMWFEDRDAYLDWIDSSRKK